MLKLIWLIATTLFLYKPKILGLGYEGEIIGLLLFSFSLMNKPKKTLKNLQHPLVILTILFFSLIILLSFFWILIHKGTFEFLFPLIKILSNIFGVIGVISFYKTNRLNFLYSLKLIYIFQILYIYIGIFFPELTKPIQGYIYNDQYELILGTYFGQRGFSFSGSIAYSFSILLSTFLIFIIFENKKLKNNSTKENIFFLLISIIPLLTAARISFITIILLLTLILIQSKSKKSLLFLILSFLSLGIYYLNYIPLDQIRLLVFVFEPLINFFNGEGFVTSSSQKLFDEMYFQIGLEKLYYGTGMYFNPDGSYYGYTDSGYMRIILFFGLPLAITFIFFNFLMIKILINRSNHHPTLFLTIILFMLVYQIKGDIIGYNVDFYSVIFIFLFSSFLSNDYINIINPL